MVTISWGVDDVTEGTKTFDTLDAALQYAQADFDLSDEQVQELRVDGQVAMPTAFDAFDWIEATRT